MAAWPVALGDSDVWFHLAGGRRLFETGSIPREAFVSYLGPRPWHNYTWLFEALVYAAHSALGYGGLVALRSAVFAAMGALMLGLLWGDRSLRPGALRAAAFALALCVLAERCKLVRPHDLEYLLLAAFLYLLERKPERQLWLPALALIWGNVHGISYPVMAAVLAAYALERRVKPWTGAACLAALCATPLGWRTLATPFGVADIGPFMQEALPTRWGELASLQVIDGLLTQRSASNLLLALSLAALVARGRVVRPAHLALWATGAALLLRGNRFRAEAALLWLPLLAEPWPASSPRGDPSPWLRRLAWAAAAGLPPALLWEMFGTRPAYPFSPRQLPVGTAAFLESRGPGGRILNYPTQGAYLEWRLFPRHLIHSDMNALHAFTPEDTYEAAAAFTDADALANVLERHRPDFIAAPRYLPGFEALIARHARYVPVFFDEVSALYADSSRHPGFAREHQLPLSPYLVSGRYPEAPPGSQSATGDAPLPAWLERMLSIDPHGLTIRVLAASRLLDGRDAVRALALSSEVARHHPEQPVGHLLRGDALRALGRPREAIAPYRLALRLADPEGGRLAQRKLAAAWAALGDWKQAYRHLRRGTAHEATDLGREGTFRLAVAALRAGEEGEAERLLDRLYRLHTPPGTDVEAQRSEDARRWGGPELPY